MNETEYNFHIFLTSLIISLKTRSYPCAASNIINDLSVEVNFLVNSIDAFKTETYLKCV